MGDIAGVAPKRTLGIQGKCDGHRNVDGARILQHKRGLGTRATLATGDGALRCDGLIHAMLQRLVLRDAKVELIEAEEKGVPVLQGKSNRKLGPYVLFCFIVLFVK